MSGIQLFEGREVRREWNIEEEQWYFSVVDIVALLTESVNSTDYLKKLRKRDAQLGIYLGTNCPQVAMSINGKRRLTLAGNVQAILRLVQSIPSPKAEPFKVWLAKVGYERIQEIHDPAQGLERARENWQKLGRSERWIQQRMTGQETRNKLTDYWKDTGIDAPDEFALLTNIIHQEWSGLSVKGHKALKSLKTQNLRDHMSEGELLFTALAELATRQIAHKSKAQGLKENAVASKRGGGVAKVAREEFETQTGVRVVTGENFLPPPLKKTLLSQSKAK